MSKASTTADATWVKSWLNDRYETDCCVLTGRAASAIYVLLKALGRPGSGVMAPSITCPAAIYPIVLAGYRPVFVDVSLDDFNMDPLAMDRAAGGDEIAAVLAIHSYGHWLDLVPLERWCRSRDAWLIEDMCQIMGSGDEGRRGHAAVASFGHSKPIDCGDGGVLLLRDRRLSEAVMREALALPDKPKHFDMLASEYRAAYYRLWYRARRLNPSVRSGFAQFAERFSYLHLYGNDTVPWASVKDGLRGIDRIAKGRRAKAAIYRDALAGLPLRMAREDARDMPWRFTFAMEDDTLQGALTNALRAGGMHASNWYPSLSQDWDEPAERCPHAAWFESRVLNLWVDDSVNESEVRTTAMFIVDFMSRITADASAR